MTAAQFKMGTWPAEKALRVNSGGMESNLAVGFRWQRRVGGVKGGLTLSAPRSVINFAMDVVQKVGDPVAKRGKLGGKKQVWRCERCSLDLVVPFNASGPPCPTCASQTIPMLQPLMRNGRVVTELPSTTEIRNYVIRQLNALSSHS